MEQLSYSIRIDTSESNYETVSKTLEINNQDFSRGWIYEIQSKENEYVDFINKFLDILEGKYEMLNDLGVSRENITIWLIYEYNNQCNLEFHPDDLKRLGDNEISLCVSCYETGEVHRHR